MGASKRGSPATTAGRPQFRSGRHAQSDGHPYAVLLSEQEMARLGAALTGVAPGAERRELEDVRALLPPSHLGQHGREHGGLAVGHRRSPRLHEPADDEALTPLHPPLSLIPLIEGVTSVS